MRNFTSALGVRCQFCHVGQEGQPLAPFDFASDQKRNKLVARQMLRMVAEINALAYRYQPNGRGTVGFMQVKPNSRNVIPGEVRFSVDLRHPLVRDVAYLGVCEVDDPRFISTVAASLEMRWLGVA